uniref:Uncharacterized protein n=1 Tax=Arundo donax TaxID=35708 RepID=A0A0A9D6G2_ARUDO
MPLNMSLHVTIVLLCFMNFHCLINLLLDSFHMICGIFNSLRPLLCNCCYLFLFIFLTRSSMLWTSQVKESESNPLISDSLSTAENGGSAEDDEPLKVPMWSSKYSKA